MADIIRDSALGQIIRFASGKRYLKYAEEKDGFEFPTPVVEHQHHQRQKSHAVLEPTPTPSNPEEYEKTEEAEAVNACLSDSSSSTSSVTDLERAETHDLRTSFSRNSIAEAMGEKVESRPIQPTLTSDGTILVDWYTTDDSDNPLNWSVKKRVFVSTQILLYTFAVYMGSSVYAPSIQGVMAYFNVSETEASLGIALYVFGYGIGPLVFSPLSEMPIIGRSPLYILTFGIFVVLTLPAALTTSFGGLIVIRFLLGVFGSPSLATGGATLQDMFHLLKVPYVLSIWAAFATFGPALAPVIAAFSVEAETWRWSEWEMLWLSGPIFVMMFIALPETSADNILLRRAQRLRKALGNEKLKSQSEIDQAHLSISTITYEALLIPWKINALDPAVAFTTFYTGLLYMIYYSFFESFPLVYTAMYNFDLGQSSLPFLSILVALMLFLPIYLFHYYWTVQRNFATNGFGAPERRLIPALFATYLIPIGLFLFAWSSRPDVHWIVPTIGAGMSVGGTYIVFQSIFLYLPFTYPRYSASLFAMNDFARSTLAASAILFSRPMFLKLGIAWGVSLLAFLTIVCTVGVYVLYWCGAGLRARSRFADKKTVWEEEK